MQKNEKIAFRFLHKINCLMQLILAPHPCAAGISEKNQRFLNRKPTLPKCMVKKIMALLC
ncbi:MAG: hypothetical protein AXA67_02980 [Methylothermaceae bacteria B42]|nr:MAG: hypothetical protein AXA67_02980 [Methylothermaceae bacteria B42]